MAKILLFTGTHMHYDRSIKINGLAHKALELLKADTGIKQGVFASVAIVEAIENEHPHVYKQLRDWALRNDQAEELQELEAEGHDLKAK
jgi:hypothetical protein